MGELGWLHPMTIARPTIHMALVGHLPTICSCHIYMGGEVKAREMGERVAWRCIVCEWWMSPTFVGDVILIFNF